jgi:uncharacterized Rmd1/YagE family protein
MPFLLPEKMQYVVNGTDTAKRQQQFGKQCGVHFIVIIIIIINVTVVLTQLFCNISTE